MPTMKLYSVEFPDKRIFAQLAGGVDEAEGKRLAIDSMTQMVVEHIKETIEIVEIDTETRAVVSQQAEEQA